MSFGTTIRARTLNALPLRQRSLSVPWLGITDAAETWGEREVLAISAFLDVAHDAPGWDADGRPVEP